MSGAGMAGNFECSGVEVDLASVLDSGNTGIFSVATHARGPEGVLPLTEAMLLEQPSGNLFGLTQNAGMGWTPAALGGKQVAEFEHPRRCACARRDAHCPGLSHWTLGSGPASS